MSDETPASPPAEVGNPLMTRRRLLVSGAAGAATAYGLTASGAAARAAFRSARRAAAAGTGRRGSVGLPLGPAYGGCRNRHHRLELLRLRAEEGDGCGVRQVRQGVGHAG